MKYGLPITLATLFAPTVYAATAEQWRSRSIYQLITDRFALPAGANRNACNVEDRTWCGGTWSTIRENLDYIQNAGFTAIWISPINQNYEGPRPYWGDAYHGYWIADATQLNARFGTEDELKALIAEVHNRDMYIMIDVVVNNVMATSTSPDYSKYMFKDPALYHPYCPIQWGNSESEQNCWMGDDKVPLPDLDTTNPTVIDTYKTWIKDLVSKYNIDGLRIDAAKHVQASFWPEFCASAGVFCMGEVFSSDVGGAAQYQGPLDSVLNFPMQNALVRAFSSSGEKNIGAIPSVLNESKQKFRDITVLGNFLENQDMGRWASFSSDMQTTHNAMTFNFMSDGIPVVYYGQEQGFASASDPYNREPLWPSGYALTYTYNITSQLNQLRNHLVRTSDWLSSWHMDLAGLQSLKLAVTAFFAGVAYAASADDWRGRSIYQVMTDRFALPAGSDLSSCTVQDRTWCGGKWSTIRDNLDYIQGLGFSAVWISPINQNWQGGRTFWGDPYHGYWIQDLNQLNEKFGTEEDLKSLISELHRRGMYVMVDIVVNNVMATSRTPDFSPYMFKDASLYHPYCPLDERNSTSMYACWIGDEHVPLPDVNTTHPTVVETYKTWIKDLVTKYEIDGLRLDAAKLVEPSFWPVFCESAGVFCMGEVFSGDVPYVASFQSQMDSLLNFPLHGALTKAFATNGAKSMKAVGDALKNIQSKFSDATVLGNFLENQDVERWMHYSPDVESLHNAMTFTFMSDGIPIVYYGQEQGFNGAKDPENREPLWHSGYALTATYNLTSTLNKVRSHLVSTTDWATSKANVIKTDTSYLAVMKGQVVSVLTNIGVNGRSDLTASVVTPYRTSTNVTNVLTCETTNVPTGGSITVKYTDGGHPAVFVPTALLKGSGICSKEEGLVTTSSVASSTVATSSTISASSTVSLSSTVSVLSSAASVSSTGSAASRASASSAASASTSLSVSNTSTANGSATASGSSRIPSTASGSTTSGSTTNVSTAILSGSPSRSVSATAGSASATNEAATGVPTIETVRGASTTRGVPTTSTSKASTATLSDSAPSTSTKGNSSASSSTTVASSTTNTSKGVSASSGSTAAAPTTTHNTSNGSGLGNSSSNESNVPGAIPVTNKPAKCIRKRSSGGKIDKVRRCRIRA